MPEPFCSDGVKSFSLAVKLCTFFSIMNVMFVHSRVCMCICVDICIYVQCMHITDAEQRQLVIEMMPFPVINIVVTHSTPSQRRRWNAQINTCILSHSPALRPSWEWNPIRGDKLLLRRSREQESGRKCRNGDAEEDSVFERREERAVQMKNGSTVSERLASTSSRHSQPVVNWITIVSQKQTV